ncbi:hypothetical protein Y032_0065g3603 [Ancylostoma ceylanicum]|uniref:Uncharacterized protein n=1 Tax=Ancylostoma ceylanicum TaxID=53326 RepID=A0A016U1U7_9BILA|nr:hypothetical protein Y032_0065g3603 [Ancylostoma ceylanicum]
MATDRRPATPTQVRASANTGVRPSGHKQSHQHATRRERERPNSSPSLHVPASSEVGSAASGDRSVLGRHSRYELQPICD